MGRTTMGCTMPCFLMESARSFKASSRMSRRGWYLPRCTMCTGSLRSSPPDSPAATTASNAAPPRRASSPRPRPLRFADDKLQGLPRRAGHFSSNRCRRACLLVYRGSGGAGRLLLAAPQHLAGEGEVGQGAAGSGVVLQGGQPEARGLGQAYVARDQGAVDLVAEMHDELGRDLVGEVVARVEHGAQQALDLELGVH